MRRERTTKLESKPRGLVHMSKKCRELFEKANMRFVMATKRIVECIRCSMDQYRDRSHRVLTRNLTHAITARKSMIDQGCQHLRFTPRPDIGTASPHQNHTGNSRWKHRSLLPITMEQFDDENQTRRSGKRSQYRRSVPARVHGFASRPFRPFQQTFFLCLGSSVNADPSHIFCHRARVFT
jgi:hypothetical protein